MKQFLAPENTMLAPGAVACTASTSSVSSPYQPPAVPHTSLSLNVRERVWLNCELLSG